MKKNYYVLGIWVFMTWIITAVHHIYTGYIYNTPWRADFAYSAAIPTAICLLVLLLHYHFSLRIFKIMVSMQITIFFFLVIGIWEGGWCHTTKLICYFMGIPFHNAPATWNIPGAPIPTDIFSEVTGVLNFVFAVFAFYHFFRWYAATKEHSSLSAIRRRFKRILMKDYGRQVGMDLYATFDDNYENLFSNRTPIENKALRRHQDYVILPGIALYDAFGTNEATMASPLTAMDIFYEHYYYNSKIMYQLLGRLPFYFNLLKGMAKKQMTVTYPSCGFNTTWLHNSNERIEFHVDKCFYYSTLKSYNRSELTACYCTVDDYLYKNMSKKISWDRNKTLGRGDNLCNFCFSKR